jgi:hypothetical protein
VVVLPTVVVVVVPPGVVVVPPAVVVVPPVVVVAPPVVVVAPLVVVVAPFGVTCHTCMNLTLIKYGRCWTWNNPSKSPSCDSLVHNIRVVPKRCASISRNRTSMKSEYMTWSIYVEVKIVCPTTTMTFGLSTVLIRV